MLLNRRVAGTTGRPARKAAALTSALVLGLVLSSCTSSDADARGYTVPDSLCGTTVDPALLSPFLPSGEKLTTRKESPSGGTKRCTLLVDGEQSVVASRIWWKQGDGVTQVASVHAQVGKGEVSDDSRSLFSATGGVGKTEGCADPGHPEQNLFTVIQVFAPGKGDASAMKRLVPAYTKAVEGSAECRPPQGAAGS